jgi:hypothetical protein
MEFLAVLPEFLRGNKEREERFTNITIKKAKDAGYTSFNFEEDATSGDLVILGARGKAVVIEGYEGGKDPYKQSIIDRLDRQNNKGLEKYQIALHENKDLRIGERFEHLAEELTDGLNYIEHAKALMIDCEDYVLEAISMIAVIALDLPQNSKTRNQLTNLVENYLNPVAKAMGDMNPTTAGSEK